MSRETRLALARAEVRKGLWWAWFGGGLIWTAVVEAPGALDAAWGLAGPGVPAAMTGLALGTALAARRARGTPVTGVSAAMGPLVVSGLAPSVVVVAVALVVAGLAGGWVVGSVGWQADDGSGPAAAAGGLSLAAAAGGLILLPLSALWLAALGTAVLLSGPVKARPTRVAPPSVGGGADADDSLLGATDLKVAFGGRVVLDGASLRLSSGELVALVGANGSGKSTLLRVLGGHLLPDSGDLWVRGQSVLGSAPEEMTRLGVSLASGSRPVFPDLTVGDNLAVASWVLGGNRRTRQDEAQQALGRFPEIASLSGAPAGTLSGGEQRLLALAQSLLTRPVVLLADEITLGLSPTARKRALAMLRAAADAGAAVLVVEHELRDLMPLTDRVIRLDEGALTDSVDGQAAPARFMPGER